MTDEILARLERLESANAALRGQVAALTVDAVRAGRSRRDALSAADMNALLAPRSMANPIGARTARDSTPDLGAPLMARLRDDGNVAGFAGGSIEGGYPNLLADPLFDSVGLITLGGGPIVIGTSYTTVSSEWEVKYVLNSGTAPGSLHLTNPTPRGTAGNNYGYEHSSSPWVTITHGPASGDVTIYLRAVTAFSGYSTFLPSWLTAAARLVGGGVSATSTATGYVEIVDGTDTVVAQSDPIDLATVDSLAESALASAALEAPAAATSYRWRLRLDLAGLAGDVEIIGVSNPLLAFSDDGTPPPFTPAVGFMFTGGSAAATITFQGARVYRTAAQSINDSTDTAITFPSASSTEEYDTDAFHDGTSSTSHMTIPEDGKYHIDAGVEWQANAAGVRAMWLRKNGTATEIAKDRELNPLAATQPYTHISTDLDLVAGDYLEVMVRQNSGGALNVNGADRNTYFSIHRLGGITGATGPAGPATLTDHTHATTGSGATGGGATLTPVSLTIPVSVGPTPTAAGDIKFDSSIGRPVIGDGVNTLTMGTLTASAPTTQAFGDVAAAGSSNSSARRDHLHGMPANPVSYAVPALTLGTANAAGAASTLIRSDATILAFDATAPANTTPNAAGTAGAATVAARRDHTHLSPGGIASRTTATAGITTTETQVIGATIPANLLTAGSTFRIRAWGVGTSTVANVVTLRCRFGTTTLTGNIPVSMAPTATTTASAHSFSIDMEIVVRSIGAGGTVIGAARINSGGSQPFSTAVSNTTSTATVALDTTANKIIELTCVTAAGTTTITFHVASIEWVKL